MTKLPNADKAIIKSEKLLKYILSLEHPVGKSKAAFFSKFGYKAINCEAFEKDLRILIQSQEVYTSKASQFGINYVVEGLMKSPSGEAIKVCTVWVILKGEDIPHFVTAYSGGRK